LQLYLKSRLKVWMVNALAVFNLNAQALPDLGDPGATLILTPQQAQQLGHSIFQTLQTAMQLNEDPIINDYIQTLGNRLVATHRTNPLSYHFFLVKEPKINAFALPGGYIGINTGLILQTETESELAGVLAHEVAHVHLHHIARSLQYQQRIQLSVLAGLIASAIIATQDFETGQGAMAATLAGSTQAMLNFTRENEEEADFVGIHSLAAAGFDPQGMPRFFQRMGDASRYDGRGAPEYLSTHPFSEHRMLKATERAQNYPYKQFPDSCHYLLSKARLQVASFHAPAQAVEYFAGHLANKTYRSEVSTLYGYGLALFSHKQLKQAWHVFEQLAVAYPNEALFQLALADTEIEQQHYTKAQARLKAALNNTPHHYPLILSLAQLMLLTEQANEALSLLEGAQRQLAAQPKIYALLAQAYTQLQQPEAAHRMQAEYLLRLGRWQAALTQLRLALKLKSLSQYQQQRIQAQIQAIEGAPIPSL